MRVELYHALLLATALYVLWRGDRMLRDVTAIWCVAVELSFLAEHRFTVPFRTTDPLLIVIDVVTAAAFFALSVRFDRRWLSWITSLQIITAATHFVAAADIGIQRWAYQIFVAGPGWAILGILAGAAWRGRRVRAAVGRYWPI